MCAVGLLMFLDLQFDAQGCAKSRAPIEKYRYIYAYEYALYMAAVTSSTSTPKTPTKIPTMIHSSTQLTMRYAVRNYIDTLYHHHHPIETYFTYTPVSLTRCTDSKLLTRRLNCSENCWSLPEDCIEDGSTKERNGGAF
jgi:hypothetical protein